MKPTTAPLTHPPEKTAAGDRFVVMLQVGTCKGSPAFEPLGYGLVGQPAPEQLLRRGCRCTGFKTEQEARKWLERSAEAWERDGCTFHHGKQVVILKVEDFA